MSDRLDIAVDLYESMLARRVMVTEPRERDMIDRFWPAIMERLGEAQKFMFSGEINPLVAKSDEIKENAKMMAQMGLFHLPYFRTYFEYVERFDAEKYKGLWAGHASDDMRRLFDKAHGMRVLHGVYAEEDDGIISIESYGKLPEILPGIGGWQRHPAKHVLNVDDLTFSTRGSSGGPGDSYSISAIFFLVVLLGTVGVDADLVRPPEKLNRSRIKKGRTPFFEHKLLRLNLDPAHTEKVHEGSGRKSPRMHIRRGHIRYRDRSPEQWRWIKPMLVGMVRNGVMTHSYEVRGA